MSFYGNVKRIGSSTFLFDKIYKTRNDMDNECSNDGVYAGRYVLVEYGERYTEENGIRVEREEYRNNYNTDHEIYGNVYDSTVWQKVYVNYNKGPENSQTYSEKYIMVAELNALAPKLTLVEDETATLKMANDNEDEMQLYYGDNNEQLHKVKEIQANRPYFDEVQDTELEYYLHMPKPLELEVNDTIDYHAEKFDIYHSYLTENSGGNFIGWKPKLDGEEANKITDIENGGKQLTSDAQFSKQELNMYLPAFGDVLGALYDTLFGKAATDGGIRPYFSSQGLTSSDLENIDTTAFEGDADISHILANNSEGLAGVLSSLFADRSIPGQIRYYLMSDWLAKNMNNDTNTPGIVNKPKVVVETSNKTDKNYNYHYTIDYNNWSLSSIINNEDNP